MARQSGQRLAEERKRHGLTQAQLAQTMGVTPGRVSQIERGGLTAERGVFCNDRFTADGEVRFRDGQIGRQLTLAGASLRNPTGTAIDAERLTVDGAVPGRRLHGRGPGLGGNPAPKMGGSRLPPAGPRP
jgi:Helix-turn-helix